TFAACSSGYTSAQLTDGQHTFDVRVSDVATNTSTASRTFTVDTAAPTATITGDVAQNGFTKDNTPSFTFTSEAGATFECRSDSGPCAACTPGYTSAQLTDGPHTSKARVSAAATKNSTATRNFPVDTAAPTATITGDVAQDGVTNDNTPRFTFTAEAGATVE